MAKEKPIKGKIVFAYLVLLAVTMSMAAILLHERRTTREIEAEAHGIRFAHNKINTVHHRITELAMRGESAMAWTDADSARYDSLLHETDTMLQGMKKSCAEYVQPSLVDSVCLQLRRKGEHLKDFMLTVRDHNNSDTIFMERLPTAVRRATEVKTVTRKKSGLAGLFGGKKKVRIQPTRKAKRQLAELNEELITNHEERQKDIKAYTDSLRKSNGRLNERLNTLLTELDTQTRKAITSKEERISEARMRTFFLLAAVITLATVLLAILTMNIRREMKRRRREWVRREELIGELRDSNEQKEELLAARRRTIQNITHELRTPLTTIMGNAELVLKGEKELQDVHANAIFDNAKTMDGMLSYLLNYFRLTNGKETVIRKPINLASIADKLEGIFAIQAENKGITLNVENTAAGVANADKDIILRIGKNLLSNALKFTERGGAITFRTSYDNGIFHIEVADTGTGMDRDDTRRIFNSFERLSNAVDKDGFGLGLTIVKELVDLMCGNITVESLKGVGSKFTVHIPMEEIVEQDSSENNHRDLGYNENDGIKSIHSVIVIDDSQMHLNLISEMLAVYGIKCDTCKDVYSLTELLRCDDYDALITDIRMSGTSGYDILHILKKTTIRKLNELPVIAMTAIGSISERELIDAGFTACLFKPFSLHDLTVAVGKCAGNENKQQNPDFTALLSFGNKRERLDCIIVETKNDLRQLCETWDRKDFASMRKILHKLGSAWILVKSDKPLKELFALLDKTDIDDCEVQANVDAVLACGHTIINEAERIKEELPCQG